MKKSLLLFTLTGLIFSGCESSHNESNAAYETIAEEYTETRSDESSVAYETIAEEYADLEDFAEIQIAAETQASAATRRVTAEPQTPAATGTGTVPTAEVLQTKKIIKTGRMGIRVARINEAKRRVDSLLAAHQGYYASEIYKDGYRSDLILTIRVPQARFDAFTAALEAGRGEMLYKNISARDVGEEYLDTEIRLANKRSSLERYREILRRATTIREILEVEQYIRRLEEEIESSQGRLRYLDNQTAYSTLELTLSTEQPPVSSGNHFWSRLKMAFTSGWSGIVTFLIGLIYLWPFLLIGSVAWALTRWQIKRRKERKEQKTPDRF